MYSSMVLPLLFLVAVNCHTTPNSNSNQGYQTTSTPAPRNPRNAPTTVPKTDPTSRSPAPRNPRNAPTTIAPKTRPTPNTPAPRNPRNANINCTKEQLDERNRCKSKVESSAEYKLVKAQVQALLPQCVPNYPNDCIRRNDLADNCLRQLEFNANQNQSLSPDDKRKAIRAINNCLPLFSDEFWKTMEDKLRRRPAKDQPQVAPNSEKQQGQSSFTTPRQGATPISAGTSASLQQGQEQGKISGNNSQNGQEQRQGQEQEQRQNQSQGQGRNEQGQGNNEQGQGRSNGQEKGRENNGYEQCVPSAQQFSCLIDALLQTNQMAEMAQRLLQEQRQCKNNAEASCQFDGDFNSQNCSNNDLKAIVDQLKGQLQDCIGNQK